MQTIEDVLRYDVQGVDALLTELGGCAVSLFMAALLFRWMLGRMLNRMQTFGLPDGVAKESQRRLRTIKTLEAKVSELEDRHEWFVEAAEVSLQERRELIEAAEISREERKELYELLELCENGIAELAASSGKVRRTYEKEGI